MSENARQQLKVHYMENGAILCGTRNASIYKLALSTTEWGEVTCFWCKKRILKEPEKEETM